MSDQSNLHLTNLSIRGFRGIERLSIPRLGRVTLLAGKNSVGKTTVLDAVRVYAARGRYPVLYELLRNRQEVTEAPDEDGDRTPELDWKSLFFGRDTYEIGEVCVGPKDESDQLSIRAIDDPQKDLFSDDNDRIGIEVSFRANRQLLVGLHSTRRYPYSRSRRMPPEEEPAPAISCEFLGPGMLSEGQTSRLWDSVTLTDDEAEVIKALEMVIGDEVVGLAMVGNSVSRAVREVRRVIVRLKSQDRPVPLRSLGDGAVRLFGVAVALANSRGGFLLIDEAENGIYYSVQYDLWKMILRTAQANDIQVLATTHSWDCVRGFAYAASEFDDAEGILVRLDRDEEGLRAIEYSEEDLKIAADQGIEVR